MDNCMYRPKKITIKQLDTFRNARVMPVDGINIANILVPVHLVNKKRVTETDDTISVHIRHLFNCLTKDNMAQSREQLKHIIATRASSARSLEDAAKEMLMNFIINEINIENYVQLLNSVYTTCVESSVDPNTGEKKLSDTLGNYFLNICRSMIIPAVSEPNVRKLALLDQYDEEQLDTYSRETDKIINLVITICHFYGQRNTNLMKLHSQHMYVLVNNVMNMYCNTTREIKKLNKDDDEYDTELEILTKMNVLYAEIIYTFMQRKGEDFKTDEVPLFVNAAAAAGAAAGAATGAAIGSASEREQKICVKNLVDKFKNTICPSLTEKYLISKCHELNI